jgi:hypothetical protein
MSYFNMVSHNPPTIMVSIQSDPKSPDGLKGGSVYRDPGRGVKDRELACVFGKGRPLALSCSMTSGKGRSQFKYDRGVRTRGGRWKGGPVHVPRLGEVTVLPADDPSSASTTDRPYQNRGPADLSDTSRNVLSTRQFCCSIISETFVEAANYTSIDAPPEISEWDLSGLTPRQSE